MKLVWGNKDENKNEINIFYTSQTFYKWQQFFFSKIFAYTIVIK